jgi:predicted transcriptional regulator
MLANGNTSDFDQFLKDAAARAAANDPSHVTIRQLLARMGQKRRGYLVIRRIEQALSAAGLQSDPPFTQGWIDNEIQLVATRVEESKTNVATTADIGLKVASLASANRKVEAVTREGTIEHAISLMQLKDYSQLAVMSSPRTLDGVVTWQSIAQARLRSSDAVLKDAISHHPMEIHFDEDLIPLIPPIIDCGFAFVRAKDGMICGIVTPADLSTRFAELAEPFLALEELERRLRLVIDRHFSPPEICAAADPTDEREVEGADDLSLGEAIRLLQDPGNFARLNWHADRKVFVTALDELRLIRNDVVHFSPDPLEEQQIASLHNFIRWLRALEPGE